MSMLITATVRIRDFAVLKRAIEKMDMHIVMDAVYEQAWFPGEERGTYIGTVCTKRGEVKCNIYKNDKAYSLVAFSQDTDFSDPGAGNGELQARLDEIRQRYAVEEVLQTAHQQGWGCLRVHEKDGTVHVRLAV